MIVANPKNRATGVARRETEAAWVNDLIRFRGLDLEGEFISLSERDGWRRDHGRDER